MPSIASTCRGLLHCPVSTRPAVCLCPIPPRPSRTGSLGPCFPTAAPLPPAGVLSCLPVGGLQALRTHCVPCIRYKLTVLASRRAPNLRAWHQGYRKPLPLLQHSPHPHQKLRHSAAGLQPPALAAATATAATQHKCSRLPLQSRLVYCLRPTLEPWRPCSASALRWRRQAARPALQVRDRSFAATAACWLSPPLPAVTTAPYCTPRSLLPFVQPSGRCARPPCAVRLRPTHLRRYHPRRQGQAPARPACRSSLSAGRSSL